MKAFAATAKRNDVCGIVPSVGITIGAVALAVGAWFFLAYFGDTLLAEWGIREWCVPATLALLLVSLALFVARQWIISVDNDLPRVLPTALLVAAYVVALVMPLFFAVAFGLSAADAFTAGKTSDGVFCACLSAFTVVILAVLVKKSMSVNTFLCESLLSVAACVSPLIGAGGLIVGVLAIGVVLSIALLCILIRLLPALIAIALCAK